jgi:hypothetical protein
LRWLGRRGDALTVRRLELALLDPITAIPRCALVDALRERDPQGSRGLARAVKAGRAPRRAFRARSRGARAHRRALPCVEDLARERAQRATPPSRSVRRDDRRLRRRERLRALLRCGVEPVPTSSSNRARGAPRTLPRWALELARDKRRRAGRRNCAR